MDINIAYFEWFHTWVQPFKLRPKNPSVVHTLQLPNGTTLSYIEEEPPTRKMQEATEWLYFSEKQSDDLRKTPACADTDILCPEAEPRWSRFADKECGRFYPGWVLLACQEWADGLCGRWKFHQPKYKLLNLCEPFGEGNVVSETPFGDREAGTGSKSKTPYLFEKQLKPHPPNKRLFWTKDCDLYLTNTHQGSSHESWGWDNFAPELQRSSNPKRHWYRVWGHHNGGMGPQFKVTTIERLIQYCNRSLEELYATEGFDKLEFDLLEFDPGSWQDGANFTTLVRSFDTMDSDSV